MSTSDASFAFEIMESLDLTKEQIACFEIMLRDDAEAHHKAGDGAKAGELSRRANYLGGMRSRARISTYGDVQRNSEIAALLNRPIPATPQTKARARAQLLALKQKGLRPNYGR